MSREVRPSDFEGKTVWKVDCNAVNCLTFDLMDAQGRRSTVVLEVECIQASLQLFGIAVVENAPGPTGLLSSADDPVT